MMSESTEERTVYVAASIVREAAKAAYHAARAELVEAREAYDAERAGRISAARDATNAAFATYDAADYAYAVAQDALMAVEEMPAVDAARTAWANAGVDLNAARARIAASVRDRQAAPDVTRASQAALSSAYAAYDVAHAAYAVALAEALAPRETLEGSTLEGPLVDATFGELTGRIDQAIEASAK